MHLNMNRQDLTIEDKIKGAVQVITNLVQSGYPGKSDAKLPFAGDLTYNDLRKILNDKILNNRDLSAQTSIMLMPLLPMMAPPVGGPGFPGGPLGAPVLPLIGGLNPVHAIKPQVHI